jgi:hypothetical protein
LAPSAARGEDTAYRSFPLGGRAVALGGAFTALGSDPSGLFYNPAGLVDVERGSLQIGTNLYGLEVQGGVTEAFGAVLDVERVASSLDIIPAAASGINVLERDASDRPITVYSLGSFVTASRNVQTSVIDQLSPSERFPGCARLAYERDLSDRRFLFGGGVSHRLGDQWSAGFAGFLAYRNLRDREAISCSDPEGGPGGPAFSSANARIDVDVFSIQLNFAAKRRFDDGWRLGMVLSTPSIRAYGRAGVRVRRSRALPESGRTTFLLREIQDLQADTKEGLAVRLGGAKVWPEQATLALDLALHAPVSYELVEVPSEEEEVLDALTLATSIERRVTINAAFGGEYLFTEDFALGGGVYTNLSSAPGIEGEDGAGFEADRLAHVDALGVTLVGGIFSEHNLTRIGFILTYGEGSDVVPRYAGLAAIGGRNQFVKTSVQRAGIFVFLSNTTRY